MQLQEWAKSNNLSASDVIKDVKRAASRGEGTFDESFPSTPTAELDDEDVAALCKLFKVTNAKAQPAQVAHQPQPIQERAPLVPRDEEYFFSGEDPRNPGKAVPTIVPLKMYAVKTTKSPTVLKIYAMDETDAQRSYIQMKNIGEPHRFYFRTEWCDSPHIHLGTELPPGSNPGPHGFYNIFETTETQVDSFKTADGFGRETVRKEWRPAKYLAWQHATWDPDAKKFMPNDSLNWESETQRFRACELQTA